MRLNPHIDPERPGELPPPDPDALAHSRRLEDRIRAEIEHAGGAIPFSRYMDLALYAPGLGYYVAGQRRFGAAGDFVTAPELGDLFARCLARQCAAVLEELGGGSILEAGAGSGALAADLLAGLERLGTLPETYLILEVSPALVARQRETLRARVPHLSDRVRWLPHLPPSGLRGIVLGNEVLDAMPVTRFRVGEGGIEVIHVGRDEPGFIEISREHDVEGLDRVAALELPKGYTSEVNVHAQGWMRSLAERLQAGLLLIVDYGFPEREYYHPQRAQGTLMCHYRHRAHTDPYRYVGLQDITAHVDFSAAARIGHEAGLSLLGYTQQASFLMALGLLDILEGELAASLPEQLALTAQVKTLTLPSEMGELFKVLAMGRGLSRPLRGFAVSDHRHRL